MKAAFLLLAAVSAAAQTFPIAGVVVDALSGAPMKRVRVTVNPYGRNAEQTAVITGQDGRFSFEMPKGKFLLMAEYRGVREPFGQRGPGLGFNVAIFTGTDQDTSNLVFKWYAPGAISGRVVDEHNEPVEGALVQLIRANVSAGRKIRATAAWAYTDDRGQYRFGARAGGTYFLAVTGEPWYSKLQTNFGLGREADAQPIRSFAPVYYPNAAEPGAAQAIELAAGAEMNADFRLTTVTGVNLHVHCEHPQGEQILVSLITEGIEGVSTYQRQEWMTGQDQIIAGVLPGRYQLRVEGRNGSTAMARRTIEVGGADMNMDVALTTSPSVSGTATFPGKRPSRTVYIRLVDESNNATLSRVLDANNTFNFQTVQPGRYRILLSSADGFFAASVQVKGAPAKGVSIDLQPGAQVKADILASDETGTVKGFVMNGDKPVAGVLAVLAPVKDKGDPGDFRSFQTDSDGSFAYQMVRAGDYILFAADRLDLEYTNPAVVRNYLASGTPVQVTPHGTAVQNVSLAGQK
jgi:uncharacterized GH25 family protein